MNDSLKQQIKKILLENANSVGYSVKTCNESDLGSYARKASIICRRRFKPQDVILLSMLDEDEEGEAGVVFTDTGIFWWEEDDNFISSVRYEEIREVDYDSNGLRLSLRNVNEDASTNGLVTVNSGNTGSDRDISASDPSISDPSIFAASLLTALTTGGSVPYSLGKAFSRRHNTCTVPCVGYDNDLDDEEEQGYIREMYNMVADIMELLQNQKDKPTINDQGINP